MGLSLVDDVDEAVSVLTRACRSATSHLSPDAQAQALPKLVAPARHQMLTMGAQAVREGRVWEFTGQGIFVRMEAHEQ